MTPLRVALVGAGSFGRNHARAISLIPEVQLSAIFDTDAAQSAQVAQEFHSSAVASIDALTGNVDAAVIAAPTQFHEELAGFLLHAGIDILVEKPIAPSSEVGDRLARLAAASGRILQVGHLERFNPAVLALKNALTLPLFFEIHRLSIFTQRSLDVDVILDLMIHDLDIVLQFTGQEPVDVQAAGISVLSPKVDIANVRLAFASGCIANLTASRVSTEKVRKLRLFQPGEYISLDYTRQEATRIAVRPSASGALPEVGFTPLPVTKDEPLRLELEAFFRSVRTRISPLVDAFQATAALRLAEQILAKIRQHSELVARTTQRMTP